MPGATIKKASENFLEFWVPRLIDSLPSNDHRHDAGLAGAGRHLAGKTIEARIGLCIRVLDIFAEFFGRHLREPDENFDGFTLTEELLALASRIAPVLQEPLRFGRHAPLARRQIAPLIHFNADRVYQRVAGYLFLKCEFTLPRTTPPSRGDRNDLDTLATARKFLPGGLAFIVQFEMPSRLFKR